MWHGKDIYAVDRVIIHKLTQQPQLAGLAVPGMPAGSPGMEMGDQQDAYQVIGLDRQGQEQVISSYPGN